MLTVAEIMTREPYTLGPDDSLANARQLMAEHHIRHIPIVSPEGSLIGVVTQRDVLAAGGAGPAARDEDTNAAKETVPLSSIMTTPVQSVDEQAGLRGTAIHLQKNRLGCLPVLRNDQLVGIITDSDFIAIAITLREQIECAEPDGYDFDEEVEDDFS